MDEPTRLQFGPAQYKIAAFRIEKKPGKFQIEMPCGSQIARAEVPEHDPGRIYVWALVPQVPKGEHPDLFDVLVTYEEHLFGVEESKVPEIQPDGSIVEGTYAHVHHIGMWTEKVCRAGETEPTLIITGHILEVLEDLLDEEALADALG